ncbi:hypothetical protein SLEP1_g56415 [Rubroshorea leprosula]|uniref:Uncharacterized protein n=1 Tax=Rubroshorea leprosula TaxID=152421 RepID=A0AAV5MML4_9ROSI|nr:hypothetical protein SLEP1_g56415 [Rubroshorea leprosula]
MEFFKELRELWGNQGREEEEGVMSMEPIAMIVSLELQDLPKTLTPKSSANSSEHEGFGGRHFSPSEGLSSERTPGVGAGVGEGISSPLPKNVDVDVNVPVVAGHTYMNYPTLTPDDLALKGKIMDYVGAKGLVDLEALVTPEALVVHEFVDVANLFSEGARSSMHRQTRFNERRPVSPPRSSSQRERGSRSTSWPHAECRVETIYAESWRHAREDSDVEDDVPLIRRRLNYGTQSGANFVPPADRQCAKGYIQQHGSHATMLKLMDNHELNDSFKRLTSDKTSLEDEVNRLQNSEMANRAALAESRANELANKVNRLKEELEKAQAEKKSGIQATKDEDAVAVATMNTMTEIYNDVCGKVLKHRSDFPIGELVFFEGKEFDEEGKSLASPVDTTVWLRWELNKDGVPIWRPLVLEEGQDFENLPRFNSWVGDAPGGS